MSPIAPAAMTVAKAEQSIFLTFLFIFVSFIR
jgi:hypothetical protein